MWCWCSFRVVEFATSDDLQNAIRKYDGYELHGRRLRMIPEKKR